MSIRVINGIIERFFYQFKKLVTPDRYTYTASEEDKA